MTQKIIKTALAIAASGLAVTAIPASALDFGAVESAPTRVVSYETPNVLQVSDQWERSRDRRHKDRRYRSSRYDGDRVSRNTRVWRGNDGRYYCRKENGTTGLLIGAAVGGLAGNEIAGRGDKTLGAILGAVGGGLLGREIDRSDARCR